MSTLGNIIWFVFGGLFIAIEYLLTGLILFLTIIGIPFGIQMMKIAGLALWPFGKEVVPMEKKKTGCFTTLITVLWLLTVGLLICLEHAILAVLFGITIIGIPFAKQHLKLAGLALMPFGMEVREKR